MNIPVLETERLILRGYQPADFPHHMAMWRDPRTLRYFSGVTYTEEESWLRFKGNVGQWGLFGHGYWGVEHKATGRYIGAMGFLDARRPFDPAWSGDPESGWMIHPDFHGQGLAREGLAAATAWADANIEAPQTWCMINPDNAPSRRSAAGAGYRDFTTAEYKGQPMLIFTRPRQSAR